MAHPGDEIAAGAAGRGRMRASHADREQVIEVLKVAFVHGRLTRDELDTRAGRALSAQTRADLAALTADIPPTPAAPAAARPTRPPSPSRRRPLARAAVRSGICLAFAAAAVWAAFILDPGPRAEAPGSSGGPGVGWCFVLAIYAVLAAVCFMGVGVAKSVEQRRSGTQLPPRPGPEGQALEAGLHGGTGHDPVPPAPVPTRPAPTYGLRARGRAGCILPGGASGSHAAYGRYRTPGNRSPSPFGLVRQ